MPLLQNKGDLDRAIEDCNIALQLDPTAFTYLTRGDAYQSKEDYDRAIADFNRALQLDPDNLDVLRSRATAYYAKGDKDRAIAELTEVLRREPTDPVAYKIRGDYLFNTSEYVGAIADYDQAIRYKPGLPATWSNRGLAHSNRGEQDLAIKDFDHALKLEPNFAMARLIAGLAFRAKGEVERAKTDSHRDVGTTERGRRDQRRTDNRPCAISQDRQRRAARSEGRHEALSGSRRSDHASQQENALVIGNSAYRNVPKLRNPVNDAHAVAAEFRRSGFAEVIETQIRR